MKILVTGAHLTPAVATIEQLKKYPDVDLIYIGRKITQEGDNTPSVESRVLPSLGVKFIPIISGRLQRSFSIHTIFSLLKIPIGFIQSFFIILIERPDVILSFGGYLAVPVCLTGWLFSIPIIIHEQTRVGGLANKICSYFADKIAISFKKNVFPNKKTILTGNPIRQNILHTKSLPKKNSLPNILIIGGNQGSHIINLAVGNCLNELLRLAKIYHQTGDSKYKDFDRLKILENDNYKIFKFIDQEWTDILSKADLVISRAGINSLTELAYLGKPTLIIPIPIKEQKFNAEYFTSLGLGKVLFQSHLSGDTLYKNIKLMINNLKDLKEKAKEAKKIIIPDAAKRLALETILLAENVQK